VEVVKPTALPPNVEGIPSLLKAEPRWVLWSYFERDKDKFTKTPMQTSGRFAKPNDPATWTTFDSVVEAYQIGYPVAGNWNDILKLRFDGIGFMLGDGWAGIDDDDCTMPLTTGAYVETSPSGNGRKFFGRGTISVEFKGGRITKRWPNARFFAVTGHGAGDVMVDLPIENLFGIAQFSDRPSFIKDGDLRGINHDVIPSPFPKQNDDDVVRTILASAQATKFVSLMRGEHDGDHSGADLALCSILMYWTQNDRDQTDRIFRDSKLVRDKWTQRSDYRKLTLDRAEYR
jgi:primase-polymerase (primpol)-like protein